MTRNLTTLSRNRLTFGALVAALAFLSILGTAPQAEAQLTYYELRSQLDPNNNLFTNTGGPIDDVNHLDPFNAANGQVQGNNIWNYRDEGVPFSAFDANATIYECTTEDCPELQARLTTGLAANTDYDVYVAYWSDGGNWGIRAGFTSDPAANTVYNVTGGANAGLDPNTNTFVAGTFGGSIIWQNPPLDNPDTSPDDPSPFINTTDLDDPNGVVPTEQRMYLALVGTMNSGASSRIDVYLDDLTTDPNAPVDANARTWMDGLAFVPAGTAIALTATLDRDTGELTLLNPTATALTILSYSVTSASGQLNSAGWDEIQNGESNIVDAGWTVSSTPGASVIELAEMDGAPGSMAILPAAADPNTPSEMRFGNVYVPTPVGLDDIEIILNLAGGTQIQVVPIYDPNTAGIALGDFDADGTPVDLDDFLRLRDHIFDPNLPNMTATERWQFGDMNLDGQINFVDFLAFRTAFNALNGEGAFEAMLAQIPEPATGLLALAGLGFLGFRRGRRTAVRGTASRHEAARARAQLRPPLRTSTLVAALLTVVCAASTLYAQVTPVTGWWANSPIVAPVVSNASTNSPTIGNGTAQNADDTRVWAALQDAITLANGEEVVLTGSVTLVGHDPGLGDGMRIGLFNGNNWYDPNTNPTYDPNDETFATVEGTGITPTSWGGFLATTSNTTGAGGPFNGNFDAKNPNWTGFSTGASVFISTFGDNVGLNGAGGLDPMVPGAPNDGAKVVRLAAGPPQRGNMSDATYNFEIRVGRFGDENTMSVKVESQDTLQPLGDFNNDLVVDGEDFLLWQRNPAIGNLSDWEDTYGDTGSFDSRYLFTLSATASPLQDTDPNSLIPAEFDRVGFLFSNSNNTDQAIFNDINIEKAQIETLILDVNTVTGNTQIRNNAGVSFDIIYYEITSANGNIDSAGWDSIDSTEGGDPVGTGWDEFGLPSANVIGELNLTGSLTVDDTDTIPLGSAFDEGTPALDRDLVFFFATTDGALIRGLINYNDSVPLAAVPEPSTIVLLAAGGMLLVRRRRVLA